MTNLIAVFLLIAAFVAEISGKALNIKFTAQADCDAADAPTTSNNCANGRECINNGKYQVSHARILFTDNRGKINGIAACSVIGGKNCQVIGKEEGKAYILLIVTLTHSSPEDQNVHYMYSQDLFGLNRLRQPDTPDSNKPIHNLKNFLYVESASYGAHTFKIPSGCKSNRVKSLISGHGYFIAEMTSGKGDWHNMYYLPHKPGQYIFTPK